MASLLLKPCKGDKDDIGISLYRLPEENGTGFS